MLTILKALKRSQTKRAGRALHSWRSRFEPLEDRHLLAGDYLVTPLVSDQAGVAPIRDPKLVNPWGVSDPSNGNFWIADNGTGVSTVYNGDVNGSPLQKNPVLPQVTIPGGAPTGVVFNGTSDFVVSNGTSSGPALFIFASEGGKISGWNPNVPPPAPSTRAQVEVTFNQAVFKGLTLANNGTANYLYAADFHNNKIDVFDTHFHLAHLSGSFTDPNIPSNYAPFNVANLNGKLYVTYAQQLPDKHDDAAGGGHGFIDVFDTNGNLQQRLVSRGVLNSPWGMAIAPSNFGEFSNDLLVGNFGNGHINAFNPTTGRFLGPLTAPNEHPLHIDGLWGLTFGNGNTAGDANSLYFTAGTNGEADGLFGKITVASGSAATLTAQQSSAVGQGLQPTGGSSTGSATDHVMATVGQAVSTATSGGQSQSSTPQQVIAGIAGTPQGRSALHTVLKHLDPIEDFIEAHIKSKVGGNG